MKSYLLFYYSSSSIMGNKLNSFIGYFIKIGKKIFLNDCDWSNIRILSKRWTIIMTTDLIFQMELLLFCWKYFIEKVYKLISLTIGTSLPSQWMLFATLIHFAKKYCNSQSRLFLFRLNYILHLSINWD